MLSLDSKITIPEDVLFYEVSNQVDDEMVILNLATSEYYSLDEVGTRMWLLIHEHSQLKAVHQVMQEEYAVEPNNWSTTCWTWPSACWRMGWCKSMRHKLKAACH